jgi:hypothetical protein
MMFYISSTKRSLTKNIAAKDILISQVVTKWIYHNSVFYLGGLLFHLRGKAYFIWVETSI